MKNIILSLVTAENYMTIIAATVILVVVLYVASVVFGKKNTKIAVVTTCSMTLAAIVCVATIVTSVPYMGQDVDAYVNQSAESMLDNYSIDSSMVSIDFNNQQ